MRFKCPKGEVVCTSYYNCKHERLFIITSKPMRDVFFIYGLENGEYKKLGKSGNPLELEAKHDVESKIRKGFSEECHNLQSLTTTLDREGLLRFRQDIASAEVTAGNAAFRQID